MFMKGDPKGKKFTLLHCWHVLKDKPKWVDRRREIGCAKKPGNKKQKKIANSFPASAAAGPVVPFPIDDDSEPPARPDGKKKEKQKLKQRSTIEAMDYLMAKKKEADIEKDLKKEERCKKAFALHEERLKLEKDVARLRRGENSEFGSDHNDLRPTTILCSASSRDSCKTLQYVGVYA
jgi:type IV secretory pathway VirB10-like protein